MRAKEYLQQYRTAMRQKEAALAELTEKQNTLLGLRSVNISDTPKPPSYTRDLSDAFAAVEDSIARCNKAISDAEDVMRSVSGTIGSIADDNQREVLHCKYIRCYSWREMMITTGKSKTWIHNMHRDGLNAIDAIINANTEDINKNVYMSEQK